MQVLYDKCISLADHYSVRDSFSLFGVMPCRYV